MTTEHAEWCASRFELLPEDPSGGPTGVMGPCDCASPSYANDCRACLHSSGVHFPDCSAFVLGHIGVCGCPKYVGPPERSS